MKILSGAVQKRVMIAEATEWHMDSRSEEMWMNQELKSLEK